MSGANAKTADNWLHHSKRILVFRTDNESQGGFQERIIPRQRGSWDLFSQYKEVFPHSENLRKQWFDSIVTDHIISVGY